MCLETTTQPCSTHEFMQKTRCVDMVTPVAHAIYPNGVQLCSHRWSPMHCVRIQARWTLEHMCMCLVCRNSPGNLRTAVLLFGMLAAQTSHATGTHIGPAHDTCCVVSRMKGGHRMKGRHTG